MKITKTCGLLNSWHGALEKLPNKSYFLQYHPQQIAKDLKLLAWCGDKHLSSATAAVINENLCSVVTDSGLATQLESRALSNIFLAIHAPTVLKAPDLAEWGGTRKADWKLGTLVGATAAQIIHEANDIHAVQDLARWLLLGTVREGRGAYLNNLDREDVMELINGLLQPLGKLGN